MASLIARPDWQTLQRACYARGWTPDVFWSATLGQIGMLHGGVLDDREHDMRTGSHLAVWFGHAYRHARQRQYDLQPLDLFDPDTASGRTQAEADADRDAVREAFADLLPADQRPARDDATDGCADGASGPA